MLLLSLHAGTTLVVMRRFSVSRFWDVVRVNGVTDLFSIGAIPTLLLKSKLVAEEREHSLRFALQIGVPVSLHSEINDRWGFPWLEAYGSTEAGLITMMPLEFADEMAGSGSIGIPCPETTVRVVDDQGQSVQVGHSGEVLVRGPGLMRGYLGGAMVSSEVGEEGWLHTGDLARCDDRGFLYFSGRIKDIVRRSGENVSAPEVEDVLRAHPWIAEAAVIPVPDEVRGEEVKAYVQLVDGVTSSDLSPSMIVEYCGQNLASYKVPRYVEYCTDFPRTASMRVMKEELKSARADLTVGAWDRESGNRVR
jgi:crotonobetaine/carnitine-CoA ligase